MHISFSRIIYRERVFLIFWLESQKFFCSSQKYYDFKIIYVSCSSTKFIAYATVKLKYVEIVTSEVADLGCFTIVAFDICGRGRVSDILCNRAQELAVLFTKILLCICLCQSVWVLYLLGMRFTASVKMVCQKVFCIGTHPIHDQMFFVPKYLCISVTHGDNLRTYFGFSRDSSHSRSNVSFDSCGPSVLPLT